MSTIPPSYRNMIYHYRGPSTYPGPYTINDLALKNYGVSRELFGTTTVELDPSISFNVKDYQYVVGHDASGNELVGMYFLPVSNDSCVFDPSGKPVPGGQLVDDLIRQKQGLKPDDQIYALISYMHPEISAGTIQYLSGTEKNQFGFTHLGAYLGKGSTSNSPVAYHDHRFGCDPLKGTNYGYPCNVHLVGLSGVDQATLNRNLAMVDMLVGHGLEFPGDYLNSMFRPIYINAALMYYRDWLFQERYLLEDPTWYFYCAANKLTILNIAFNLPHNPDAFNEVYGPEQGPLVWKQFLNRYQNATGFDFFYYKGLETDFEPLWKKQGLTADQIRPFTIEQYKAYDLYTRTGAPYSGPFPVLPPQGVVCRPQTAADIVYSFEQIYADLYDAGAISSTAVIWAFMQPVVQRTGVPESEYLMFAIPVFQLLAYADAQVNATPHPTPNWQNNPWFLSYCTELRTVFGAQENADVKGMVQDIQTMIDQGMKLSDVLDKSGDADFGKIVAAFSMLKVILDWQTLMNGGVVSREDAYDQFISSASGIYEGAKGMPVTSADRIAYNAAPVIMNFISNGFYDKNPFFEVETICTAVDVAEVQLKDGIKL